MTSAQRDRYLRLLGVKPRKPSLAALAELVAAHVERVPFENVSKLYRLARGGLREVPELDEHLDGIERLRLGGTCYANNGHLHALLAALGYDARLCGADMARPDTHAVVVVGVAGAEVLVDGGYGAPFFAPMPLGLDREQAISLGRDRYVLHPRDADGRSVMDQLRDGALRHSYRVNPRPRTLADLRDVVADSFRPDSVFLNAIVIARFAPGRGVALRNFSLLEADGVSETRTALPDRAAIARAAEERFGVPRDVVDAALGVVGELPTESRA